MPPETTIIEKPAGTPTEASLGIKPPNEIKVSAMPAPAAPAAPPKKGSVRENIFAELRKKAGAEPAAAPAPAAPVEPAEPIVDEDDDFGQPPPAPAAAPAAPAAPADKKVSPWRLLDAAKAEKKQLEDRIAAFERQGVPPEKLKPFEETIAAQKKQLDELQAEMKYVNYTKTDEFKNNYQKPYEQAWQSAAESLSNATTATEAGDRKFEINDITDLVSNANLTKKALKELCEDRFGDYSEEAVEAVTKIRESFKKQSDALSKAKSDADGHFKSKAEEQQRQFGAVTTEIKSEWAKANEEALNHEKYGTYFKPVEGDQQVNQRLSKGFALADRAFSENPLAPGLTAEQRKDIVRRHAAVRNRCAAFGRLVYENTSKANRIAELESKLKEYNGAEPPAAGSAPAATVKTTPGKAWDRIRADLAKRATK